MAMMIVEIMQMSLKIIVKVKLEHVLETYLLVTMEIASLRYMFVMGTMTVLITQMKMTAINAVSRISESNSFFFIFYDT